MIRRVLDGFVIHVDMDGLTRIARENGYIQYPMRGSIGKVPCNEQGHFTAYDVMRLSVSNTTRLNKFFRIGQRLFVRLHDSYRCRIKRDTVYKDSPAMSVVVDHRLIYVVCAFDIVMGFTLNP